MQEGCQNSEYGVSAAFLFSGKSQDFVEIVLKL
jgi:hypothetical protein